MKLTRKSYHRKAGVKKIKIPVSFLILLLLFVIIISAFFVARLFFQPVSYVNKAAPLVSDNQRLLEGKFSLELKLVAQRRKEKMLGLLLSDPESFYQQAFTPAQLNRLSSEFKNAGLVEKYSEYEGTLQRIAASDDNGQTISDDYILRNAYETGNQPAENQYQIKFLNTGKYQLLDQILEASEESTPHIKILGIAIDDNILVIPDKNVSSPTLQMLSKFGLSKAIKKTGTVKYAVILFNFKDNDVEPVTRDYVSKLLYDTTSPTSPYTYFKEVSYNKLTFSAGSTKDIYGWYTITKPIPKSSCSYVAWANRALSEATKKGFNKNAYDGIIYFFPADVCSTQKYAAWGDLGGNQVYHPIKGNSLLENTVIHEIGHNLGLPDTYSLNCKTEQISSNIARCTKKKWGDNLDGMGVTRAFHFQFFEKKKIGWLSDSDLVTATKNKNSDYQIAPIESNPSSMKKALKIPREGSYYYLVDYRRPQPKVDNYFPLDKPSVVVHLITGNTSYLVDMTPKTTTLNDAMLTVGKSFYDAKLKTKLTFVRTEGTYAVVKLEYNVKAP